MPDDLGQREMFGADDSSTPGTLYLIHVLTHATRTKLDEALRAIGLSAFNYTVLSILREANGLSSSELSRRFYVTPQTMGETIAALERKDLVSRAEDPSNRRILLVSLTPTGRTLVAQSRSIVEAFEAQMFEGLSAADFNAFRRALRSILGVVRSLA